MLPPTLQARREEEKEQRRQDILDAAEQLIRDVGWAGTNFSEIAKLTELSRPLIYVYFPTREDLLHAICDRGAEVLRTLFEEALSTEKRGIDQVEAIGRAYLRFSAEYPAYFNMHSEQLTRDDAEGQGGAGPHMHPAFSLLAVALKTGLADGSIDPRLGDVRTTTLTLWTFTYGLILIGTRKAGFLRDQMHMDTSDLVDNGFQMLRRMLAPAHDAASVTR
jgi:AcrR family transcriptional regulator